jgi:release factor glutamine methyltransferase
VPPIGEAWRQVRDRFRGAGFETAELDARLLAQRAFEVDAMGLVRKERVEASEEQLKALEQFAQRRLVGEPISRIIGRREFWGLDFALNDSTLDPRPETEMLVEESLAFLEGKGSQHIVDLGTGSGAIAVSIVASLPKVKAFATDISDDALAAAKLNAERHGVAARIDFRRGPWWQAVPHTELFDLIVSNPPYIATAEIEQLSPEVRVFDPKPALDGGWDGLDAYRAIASQAIRRLNKGGLMLLEIGYNQAEIITKILARAGFDQLDVQKDLAGLDRVIRASHS